MKSDTEWCKAEASGSGGNCVELRRHNGTVQVRDSKDPNGPILSFGEREISTWLDGARKGEFDNLSH